MLRRDQILSTILEIAGAAAVVIGVAYFCTPAAWIVAGIALGVAGYALGTEASR